MERTVTRLDESELERGVAVLAASDAHLAVLAERNGVPPLWARRPGFATLVKIILEQQVSLESAAAAFDNLAAALGRIEPEGFLALDGAELKRIGFSRQKAGYVRGVASGVRDGSIDLSLLPGMDDQEAFRYLTGIRGIGPWTADVYLLFVERRRDVWPHGDRALVVSMAENLGLDDVPSYEEAGAMSRAWSPWRAVAARMLWHAYLIRRGRQLD